MSPGVAAILDILLTVIANKMADNFTVSDILKAAHAKGNQIEPEVLRAYLLEGADLLQALHEVNVARRAKNDAR